MKKINFQFHATFKEIINYIEDILQNENIELYGCVRCPEFSMQYIFMNDDILEYNKFDYFIISFNKIKICNDYKSFVNSLNNCLVIENRDRGTIIGESRIWVYSDDEIDNRWKKIISRIKKTMLKGAWVENICNNSKTYYKNHYYTIGAQKAFREGIKIAPYAGNTRYILETE